MRAKFWCMILLDSSACQQGVDFAHPAPQARKGFEMATSAARHGPSAIRHAPAPRYRPSCTHPRCPLPSSASPPRPRHGKSSPRCLRSFCLVSAPSSYLNRVDCVGGQEGRLEWRLLFGVQPQRRRPSTGRGAFPPLYLTLCMVYLVGIGQELS